MTYSIIIHTNRTRIIDILLTTTLIILLTAKDIL